MGKVIHIRPKKNAKVVGDATFYGKFTDINGKVHDHKKRAFVISGDGIVLNLDKEGDKYAWDLIQSKAFKPLFNPAAKFRYRFDILDLEKDADEYLQNDELKTDYKSQVLKLKDIELKTIGFMFKLGSDPKMIKSGLYKMIDSDTDRAKVGKFLKNVNLTLLMWVFYSLSKGDATNKKGLYKDGKDLYFYNDTVIGLGEDNMVAFLKKDTDEATTIYQIIKQEYEAALAEEAKAK